MEQYMSIAQIKHVLLCQVDQSKYPQFYVTFHTRKFVMQTYFCESILLWSFCGEWSNQGIYSFRIMSLLMYSTHHDLVIDD